MPNLPPFRSTCTESIASAHLIQVLSYVLVAISLLGVAACRDDDDGHEPPFGLNTDRQLECISDVVDPSQNVALTLTGARPEFELRSMLGADSFVVVAVSFGTEDTAGVTSPWVYGTNDLFTIVVPDTGLNQSGSKFSVRAVPRGYWLPESVASNLVRVGIDFYSLVIDGSRGRGLEALLLPGDSLVVNTEPASLDQDTLVEIGIGLELIVGCSGSDAVMRPAPNGDHSVVVRSFEVFPTDQDTTYRIGLDFDVELCGGRKLVDDLLRWRGVVQFDYIEDIDGE